MPRSAVRLDAAEDTGARDTEDDDHNPPRIAPRNLFDLSVGDDNLFHGDKYKWSCPLYRHQPGEQVRALQLPLNVQRHALRDAARVDRRNRLSLLNHGRDREARPLSGRAPFAWFATSCSHTESRMKKIATVAAPGNWTRAAEGPKRKRRNAQPTMARTLGSVREGIISAAIYVAVATPVALGLTLYRLGGWTPFYEYIGIPETLGRIPPSSPCSRSCFPFWRICADVAALRGSYCSTGGGGCLVLSSCFTRPDRSLAGCVPA